MMGSNGNEGPPGKDCDGKFTEPVELNYKLRECKYLASIFKEIFPDLKLMSVQHSKAIHGFLTADHPDDHYIFEICVGNDIVRKLYSRDEINHKYSLISKIPHISGNKFSNITIITDIRNKK